MGMEYVHAALLLYHAKKEINEENLTKVIKAVDIEPDTALIKRIVDSLSKVNIEEAIKAPAIAMPAAQPAAAAPPPEKAEEKEKKAEEEKKKEEEEEAIAGLSALFG